MAGAVSGVVECEGCGSVDLMAEWWMNFAFMGVYSRPLLDRKQAVMTDRFRPEAAGCARWLLTSLRHSALGLIGKSQNVDSPRNQWRYRLFFVPVRK